jgi:Zn ribbon nucleic-acid-binding protein
MESFKLIETLSYYNEDDIEVVSLIDAVHCMKELLKEIKGKIEVSEDKTQIINFLNKLKI